MDVPCSPPRFGVIDVFASESCPTPLEHDLGVLPRRNLHTIPLEFIARHGSVWLAPLEESHDKSLRFVGYICQCAADTAKSMLSHMNEYAIMMPCTINRQKSKPTAYVLI